MLSNSRCFALWAPVFPAPDLKTPVRDLLPMNAAVPLLERRGALEAFFQTIGPGDSVRLSPYTSDLAEARITRVVK